MSGEPTPRPPSVLRAFAPVPARAKRDKRLRAADYRTLLAICDVVDPETGYALIGQISLAKHASISRGHLAERVAKLEDCRYIVRLNRGRHSAGLRKGQIKTMLYKVIYDIADAEAYHPTGGARVGEAYHPTGGGETHHPMGGGESRLRETKEEVAKSIFRAVAKADRFDRNVEDAQQLELPFAEVQRFDGLWHRAISIHGFHKIGKLSLAIRKQHRSRADYVRALTGRLEELTTEAPVDGEKHGPRKTGM